MVSRLPLAVLTALSVSATSLLAQGGDKPSLRATCTGQGAAATVHATVTNGTSREMAVRLGFLGGAEKTQVVNSIDIIAIRPATGADEDFLYVNGKYALATGPHWIVSLKAGASVDIDLPVKDFISRGNYQPLDPSVVGGTRLILDARPVAPATTKVWTGQVETVVDLCR